MSDCHTLHFIALQGYWNQSSAQEFTKSRHIWQQSPPLSGPSAWISPGEVVVVATGTGATATAIAGRYGPISLAWTTGILQEMKVMGQT